MQLMVVSRDRNVKMANLYPQMDWLRLYNASLITRGHRADAQITVLETRVQALELQLAQANRERDQQRAAAEQSARAAEERARQVESHVTMIR